MISAGRPAAAGDHRPGMAGVEVVDDLRPPPNGDAEPDLRRAQGPPAHRLICVFQPHLYARTKDFFQEFAEAFGDADEDDRRRYCSPAGREEAREVTSADLAEPPARVTSHAGEAAEAHAARPEGSIVVARWAPAR